MADADRNPETLAQKRGMRWTELIASIGVMLSLVFVGVQIRQNTAAIKAGTYQDLATQSNEINLAIATNPDLAAKYNVFRGTDSDTADATLRPLVLAIVRLSENAYYMQKMRAYDGRLLTRYEANPMYGTPAFAGWWASNRVRFAPDFQAHMDSVVAKAPPAVPGGR